MLKSNRGNAVLEVIPVLILLMVLLRYTFGFFGVIHTGILNTIASRNYAFETFRHRAMLNYFRAKVLNGVEKDKLFDNRYHGMFSEKRVGARNVSAWATQRSIDLLSIDNVAEPKGDTDGYHNSVIMSSAGFSPGQRFDKGEGVDPVWIRERYGICLNPSCGNF